ncbi:hypothetical protein BBP40_008023 [Aspergillus hancockii]|nr:hypothetical protein BBP40_008023 [Aspergillus hancockii]
MGKPTPHISTTRNGITENRHFLHAAIVTKTGTLLSRVGDPTRQTLARSTIKPAQALAILSTGALEQFSLDEADLALICASHNSEERHLTRARNMLAKVSAQESDLRCGGHDALNADVNREWIRSGYVPTAICNNCSGKHVGMIGGARALGVGIGGYHLPSHAMQGRFREVVADLGGFEGLDGGGTLLWGVDGCNLPAPALPLVSLGRIYARFAAAVDAVESGGGDLSERERGMARIFRAMTRYPELVGGEGRFCTALMQVFGGMLIGKVGADGCYGVGIRASEHTRRIGADGAIGIAVKIEDGNREILYSAVVEILEQLDIGTPEMRRELAEFHLPGIVNTAGVVTGSYTHRFVVAPAKLV